MTEPLDTGPYDAQAHIHHALLLGLQLKVSVEAGSDAMGDWMFRLFRRQHLEKFLSSFDKLGLSGLPHAVACARYHVLSNNMGGVGVEYMEESERKAWVRFRYPRWMYHGPTVCGVPVEVSRGFLNGWYAHNGVSLENPRLGYVCVSEDMTGEFGLCGYFYEYDHDLSPDERLRFAKDELPPPFVEADQPAPPVEAWNELRLAKANRNYALEYIRNGLTELAAVLGPERALDLGRRTARAIGLQYFAEVAAFVDAADGDLDAAGHFLARMFEGMGDEVEVSVDTDRAVVVQHGMRIVRGLPEDERALVQTVWAELWRGTMSAQRALKSLRFEAQDDAVVWTIQSLTDRAELAF